MCNVEILKFFHSLQGEKKKKIFVEPAVKTDIGHECSFYREKQIA